MARQVEVKEKDGAVVATVRETLSIDGDRVDHHDYEQGHADQDHRLTRSGGTKLAKDLFAGEWTEDLRQDPFAGAVLRIELTESDGVRFAVSLKPPPILMESSDSKNSRNDTVALELVDLHTVD